LPWLLRLLPWALRLLWIIRIGNRLGIRGRRWWYFCLALVALAVGFVVLVLVLIGWLISLMFR
jgi:hypothetical protein